MSKLFDLLSQEDKTIATRIIKDILSLQSEAENCLALTAEVKIKLEKVKSTIELHTITNQITEKGKIIAVTLEKATSGMNENIRVAIQEFMKEHSELNTTWNNLHFLAQLSPFITAAKERLSEQELFANKSADDKAFLNEFMDSFEKILPLAIHYGNLKIQFQTRLAIANSLDEIDKIEEEIIHCDKSSSFALSALPSPNNKELAESLKKHLSTNPRLKMTLQSFKLYEFLTDDILAARARYIDTHPTPRIG